jgi:hypothetical protein
LFDATKGLTYGAVVDQFIEQYAKPGQHTWDQTQRVLKNNCADWLTKPIAEITDKDADTLLATFSADKHDYKAALTLRWLRTLWKWAWKKKYVPERVMDRVDFRYKERARDRWYADHEIKAIWNAANKLDPIEGTYVKLLLLLAPRKTALAMMRRADLSEFDDKGNPTIWTTPSLRKRLVRHGAPRTSTSTPHVTRSRRGCGNKGRSDFEIGLNLEPCGHRRHRRIWPWLSAQTQTPLHPRTAGLRCVVFQRRTLTPLSRPTRRSTWSAHSVSISWKEATSGDYNTLLAAAMRWVAVR